MMSTVIYFYIVDNYKTFPKQYLVDAWWIIYTPHFSLHHQITRMVETTVTYCAIISNVSHMHFITK